MQHALLLYAFVIVLSFPLLVSLYRYIRIHTVIEMIHFDFLQVFPGNSDKHTVVFHVFAFKIRARYVKFVMQTWYYKGHICMRVELYGCEAV